MFAMFCFQYNKHGSNATVVFKRSQDIANIVNSVSECLPWLARCEPIRISYRNALAMLEPIRISHSNVPRRCDLDPAVQMCLQGGSQSESALEMYLQCWNQSESAIAMCLEGVI